MRFLASLTFAIFPPSALTATLAPRHSKENLPLPVAKIQKRSCGETSARVCFGINGGTAQNINPDDIQFAADYLRALSAKDGNDPLWTMPPETDCSEWTLPIYEADTALVLVKHISPRTNSSYSYLDLARTIDGGGEDATDSQRAQSLLGACGGNGGMMGILVDASDPAYLTEGYKFGRGKHEGMIMKIVRAPGS